jgi:hypothetical protein
MLVHQLALVIAVTALTLAAGWPARRIGIGLAETVLITAALAGAGAVVWTLALGLAGLAGSTVALVAGPVCAAGGTVLWGRVGPGPGPGPGAGAGAERTGAGAGNRTFAPDGSRTTTECERTPESRWIGGWRSLAPAEQVAAGAALGLLCGAVLEVARQPGFGTDAVEYHLPTALGWLQSGHAGSAQTLTYDFPVGYYPLTTEVLLTWLLGLSRSFAPLAAVGPFTAALGALGLWRMLRVVGVSRLQSWLAAGAFLALPTVLFGVNTTGPGTDLAAVSWLLCGAGIAAGVTASAVTSDRAILLGPALVACGLGVGTKTTVAPLAIIVLVLAAWRVRAGLRPAAAPLAAGAFLALAVGIPWYVRNWIVHGWPLWPFSQGPVGDRLPHTIKLFADSFLSRPKVSFDHSPGLYLKTLGGGTLMIVGALIAPLLARRRAVLVAAVVAAAALYAWAQAPFTGLAPNPLLDGLAITTVRYILAALVACLVTVSLLARPGVARWLGGGAALVTLATIVWSLVADAQLGYPAVPRPAWLLGLALAGAVLAALMVAAAGRGATPGGTGRRAARPAADRRTAAPDRPRGGFAWGPQLRLGAGLAAPCSPPSWPASPPLTGSGARPVTATPTPLSPRSCSASRGSATLTARCPSLRPSSRPWPARV